MVLELKLATRNLGGTVLVLDNEAEPTSAIVNDSHMIGGLQYISYYPNELIQYPIEGLWYYQDRRFANFPVYKKLTAPEMKISP